LHQEKDIKKNKRLGSWIRDKVGQKRSLVNKERERVLSKEVDRKWLRNNNN
jgi:hypothetical protein